MGELLMKISGNAVGIWISAVSSVFILTAVLGRQLPPLSDRDQKSLTTFTVGGQTEGVEIRPDGSFSARFMKELSVDIPLSGPKGQERYARLVIKAGVLTGQARDGKTHNKGIPVRLVVFSNPQMLSVDLLDAKHDSVVSGLAKLLGALPNVVALVCYKNKDAWLVAPQMNGHGEVENPGLIKDLLKLDDHIAPALLAQF